MNNLLIILEMDGNREIGDSFQYFAYCLSCGLALQLLVCLITFHKQVKKETYLWKVLIHARKIMMYLRKGEDIRHIWQEGGLSKLTSCLTLTGCCFGQN